MRAPSSRRRNSETPLISEFVSSLAKCDQTRTVPALSKQRSTLPTISNHSSHDGLTLNVLPSLSRNELDEMVEACAKDIDYALFCDRDAPGSAKCHDELTQLIGMIKSQALDGMDDRFFEKVLEMIRMNVFRSVPRVDKRLFWSDSPITFYVKNDRRLKLTYELFECVCSHAFWMLTGDDVDRLFLVFEMPCAFERNLALNMVEVILNQAPQFTEYVLRKALSTIERFNNGCLENHWSVEPTLRLLARYYGASPPKLEDFEVFKSLFYPTLLSPYAGSFYAALTQLSMIFQMKDAKIALWCFKYLMKHWPTLSAGKQIVFLHQVQCLLSSMPASMMRMIYDVLVKLLSECVTSPNFRVAIAAIEMCSDDCFLSTMAGITHPTVHPLMPPLVKASKHWHDSVRTNAQQAIVKCNRICAFSFSPQRRGRSYSLFQKVDARTIWRELANRSDEKKARDFASLDDTFGRCYDAPSRISASVSV